MNETINTTFSCRVKRQLKADPSYFNVMKTTRGYTGVRMEQLDISEKGKPDLKEILDIGYLNKSSLAKIQSRNKRHYLGENKWPSDNKNLENSIEIYAENSAKIAQNVLQLLAEGLGAKGHLISEANFKVFI